MNERNFNKGIKDLRKIALTATEKSAMIQHILKKPALSPYAGNFALSMRALKQALISRRVYAAIAILLLVGGAGTSFAAERAVPGDILYPIKINVNEPLRNVVTVTPQAKAEWESKKAERRLYEAHVLASKGKLNSEKRQALEQKFETHSDNFESIKVNERVEKKKEELEVRFEEKVNKQVKRLEDVKKNTKNQEQKTEIEKLEEKIQKKVDKVKSGPKKDKLKL